MDNHPIELRGLDILILSLSPVNINIQSHCISVYNECSEVRFHIDESTGFVNYILELEDMGPIMEYNIANKKYAYYQHEPPEEYENLSMSEVTTLLINKWDFDAREYGVINPLIKRYQYEISLQLYE